MGCGCKKNKNTQNISQPTEITVNTDATTTQEVSNLTLTEQQQKTVDEIIARLNQINS